MASTLVTLPREVVLRSGQRVPFDAERIRAALASAGQASGEYGAEEAALLTAQVTKVLIHRFHGEAPTVEQIQDVAEQTLIAANHLATARAYIVYREQHATLRADRQTLVDVESSINEYLTRADWRVSANANQGYSLGGLILNVAGKVTANYWLSHVYTPEIGEAHRNGDIHIHDLDMLSGYCAGWSLRTLLHEGLNGVPGKVEAGPPKHMSSAVGQIVNFLGTLQNEWAGAQAFSSFDTYMAPFVRKDGMDYAQVRQCIQELVYNLNVPSRWGTQTPFTNLTFDWTCPEDLREQVERAVINSYELTRKIQKYAEIRSTINVDGEGEAHLGQLLFEIDIEHYQGPEDFYPVQSVPLEGMDIAVDMPDGTVKPGISLNLQE